MNSPSRCWRTLSQSSPKSAVLINQSLGSSLRDVSSMSGGKSVASWREREAL